MSFFVKNLSKFRIRKNRDNCTNAKIVSVVLNVKEEPGSSPVGGTSTVATMGSVGSGMVGSTTPSSVSSSGFQSVEFQARSKCYMWIRNLSLYTSAWKKWRKTKPTDGFPYRFDMHVSPPIIEVLYAYKCWCIWSSVSAYSQQEWKLGRRELIRLD